MDAIPLDDELTYAMLARGDSVGVFQFESEGMREALQARSARPSSTTSSRSWPCTGRARWPDQHLRAQQARPEPVTYPRRPRCGRSSARPKGVILYQEQPMQIARTIAGFSGAKADDLRKAMGKKNRDPMA